MVCCIGLLVAEDRYEQMQWLRQFLSVGLAPVHEVVNAPQNLLHWGRDNLSSRESLLQQNLDLQNRVLFLETQIQLLQDFRAENARLRHVLAASERVEARTKTAELLSVDADPFTHQIIINRGSTDAVFQGQAVLDSKGLMGIVTQVNSFNSRVMLVVDEQFKVPVEFVRTGIRGNLSGIGDLNSLSIKHMPHSMDIQVGDHLVTSGLGERFPKGYPVGRVNKVAHDSGKEFADIEVTPLADIEKSRFFMLVEFYGE